MSESRKNKYFVDGFMLKHFGVWPTGLSKDNLFEEQKIFLIYLMGFVPNWEGWNLQVDYQSQLEDIEKMTLKDVELEKTDIDLAKLQGRDIEKIKRERLKNDIKQKKEELDKKFGIQPEEETPEFNFSDSIPDSEQSEYDEKTGQRKQLWEILQMKKIIKK